MSCARPRNGGRSRRTAARRSSRSLRNRPSSTASITEGVLELMSRRRGAPGSLAPSTGGWSASITRISTSCRWGASRSTCCRYSVPAQVASGSGAPCKVSPLFGVPSSEGGVCARRAPFRPSALAEIRSRRSRSSRSPSPVAQSMVTNGRGGPEASAWIASATESRPVPAFIPRVCSWAIQARPRLASSLLA